MPPLTENSSRVDWTEEQERTRGDEMFQALQANGITGDVASWLVDLAIRVRRLEARNLIGVLRNPLAAKNTDAQPTEES